MDLKDQTVKHETVNNTILGVPKSQNSLRVVRVLKYLILVVPINYPHIVQSKHSVMKWINGIQTGIIQDMQVEITIGQELRKHVMTLE
jgi:hypothetical protein